MIDIVIIGRNEAQSIRQMYEALRPYDSGNRIWILDRCTDNSEKLLQQLGEKYYKTPENLTGRQTSFSRNLGLSKCHGSHDVLFLDGDRFPVEGGLNGLPGWDKDIALLLLEKDGRSVINDYENVYGNVHNGFFSCGIFIRKKAIDKIVQFQQGELFDTGLQHVWGIEDTYLGDVCYHLGLTCGIYTGCKLRGEFDKYMLDNLDAIEKRFRKRDKLNVKW